MMNSRDRQEAMQSLILIADRLQYIRDRLCLQGTEALADETLSKLHELTDLYWPHAEKQQQHDHKTGHEDTHNSEIPSTLRGTFAKE